MKRRIQRPGKWWTSACAIRPAQSDDDRLRDRGEEERVPDRVDEDRVVELRAGSSPSPTQLPAERAGGRVGEAEIDREHERRADERADEEHRRRDQERRKEPAALRQVPEPQPSAPPWGRDRCHRSACECNQIARIATTVAAIELDQLTKVYADGTRAVQELDLEVEDGEFVVFVGPSGCGKTSRAADDRRARGHHRRGRCASAANVVNDLPPKARDMAMIFQNYALYPHMNAYDNMAFGLKMRGIDRARDQAAGRVGGARSSGSPTC